MNNSCPISYIIISSPTKILWLDKFTKLAFNLIKLK